MKATDAAVTRFRTGLEGSRAYTLAGRLSLTPSVEVGLRHDGGDAETGAGMDVGAGMVVSDAGTGLAVDVRVRTLLVHQDENFSERGVAVSLSYNPTPSTPLGFVAKVAPSWGGQAMSGAEALWGRETMAGMAHGGVAQGNRLDGEVGYGLPVGSRFVGTPRVGFSASEYGQDYRVGYGLGVLDRESMNFELGVEAQRRNSPMLGGASNEQRGARIRATSWAGRATRSRSAATGQGALVNELPSVALTQRFLALCEHHGSQPLTVRLVAVGRSTGVPGLPAGDDWTAWDAERDARGRRVSGADAHPLVPVEEPRR